MLSKRRTDVSLESIIKIRSETSKQFKYWYETKDQSYLTDHVFYMPGMCEGWSLATSMVMRSLFGGKFHIQILQQDRKNPKKYISSTFYFITLKNDYRFTISSL